MQSFGLLSYGPYVRCSSKNPLSAASYGLHVRKETVGRSRPAAECPQESSGVKAGRQPNGWPTAERKPPGLRHFHGTVTLVRDILTCAAEKHIIEANHMTTTAMMRKRRQGSFVQRASGRWKRCQNPCAPSRLGAVLPNRRCMPMRPAGLNAGPFSAKCPASRGKRVAPVNAPQVMRPDGPGPQRPAAGKRPAIGKRLQPENGRNRESSSHSWPHLPRPHSRGCGESGWYRGSDSLSPR